MNEGMRKAEQAGPTDVPCMMHRLLGRVRLILKSARVIRDISKRLPDMDETGVVFDALQERNRFPSQ